MILRFRYALLATALLAAPTTFAADARTQACVVHSTALLDALVRGDYAHAGKDFNTQITAALDADKLKQVWAQVQAQAGTYQKHAAPTLQTMAGQRMVVTRTSFANMPLNVLVACDTDGRINIFRLMPTAQSRAAQAEASGPGERAVEVKSPLGPLPGTLTMPKGAGPFPAVVLVGGSGPHDRDETIGPNKPFRDLAHGLAAAGIASLRYDKRTLVYGAKLAADTHFTVDQEVTDDALSALNALARQPHINRRRLFVIGHSLGAMLAPRIGQRDPRLAGLVLMAAPARPLLAVSAQQLRELGAGKGATATQIAAQEKAIVDERALLDKADPAQPPTGSFGNAPQSYWLSLHQYDQVAVAKGLSMPMLFLQGGADFQVSPTMDFAGWKHALGDKAPVSFHLYPGLSHLFMPAGKTGSIADYNVPAHVDAAVVDDIAAWIKAQSPR